MAPTINVTCPSCEAELRLPPEDVWLVVCSHAATYGYTCPECWSNHTGQAERGRIPAMRAAGVLYTHITDPEPSDRPDGPALTEDDLIAFGLEVEAL